MPIHDWTRVSAGTWHDFHMAWITEFRNVLNGGLLPADYYAQAEPIAGPLGPDVLTLQETQETESGTDRSAVDQTMTVAMIPPRTRIRAEAETNDYVLKRRTLVIRHISGDRIVALLEIVSPGNKSSRHAMRSFVVDGASDGRTQLCLAMSGNHHVESFIDLEQACRICQRDSRMGRYHRFALAKPVPPIRPARGGREQGAAMPSAANRRDCHFVRLLRTCARATIGTHDWPTKCVPVE